MKLWQKAAGLFRRPLSLTNSEGWRDPSVGSTAGESVTPASVLGLSAAWACVNLLSGTISSLPLMVYRTNDKGARTVAKDHALYRLLHDSPNFDQTAVDYWSFKTASIELWGNTYSRKIRENGRIVALEPILPELVSVRRLANGSLEYRWSQDGKSYVLPDTDVLHIRGFGGNPLGGMSTLTFGRSAFGLAQAINRAASATFENGMRPSGVLSVKEYLTDPQRASLDTRLVEKFVGAMNAGRPFVAEGGMTWSQLTINPEDAQMLESRGFSVEEVCRFFGVPPFMVGHTEKTTSWGSGLNEQVLGFQKFTLRPRLKRVEQALEKQLLTPAERASGLSIEFNLEGLLRADSAGRAAFYKEMSNIGAMTVNEIRALENLPPVPGGDVPRMQMQNVPITEAGKPALPAPKGNPNETV